MGPGPKTTVTRHIVPGRNDVWAEGVKAVGWSDLGVLVKQQVLEVL